MLLRSTNECTGTLMVDTGRAEVYGCELRCSNGVSDSAGSCTQARFFALGGSTLGCSTDSEGAVKESWSVRSPSLLSGAITTDITDIT